MDAKEFATINDVVGHSLRQVSDFKNFDLSFKAVARIDQQKCIRCDLCYVACNDAAHQCIDLIDKEGRAVAPAAYDPSSNGRVDAVSMRPSVVVREHDCVGCRLCFNICPVESCIHMVEVAPEQPSITWDELTAKQPQVAEDWNQMERYRRKMGIRIH
jgi:dihydropyrimidine dehydrogenase (NAD+) subunit PreA